MNYLSHLVGRTLRLNQPLEPARGNPFEPAQAHEPEDPASPEQRITQRLRPVRMDAPASAVVHAPPPGETPAQEVSVVERLDAVLSQAPAPRVVAPRGEPSMTPGATQSASESPTQVETAATPARATPMSAAHTEDATSPAASWAEASRNLRRPRADVPLQPARSERQHYATEDARRPASLTAPRSPTPVTQSRTRTVAAARSAESAATPAQRQPPGDAAPVSSAPVRRAAPLVPVMRALPPRDSATATAPAAPDVHISIGSVEIRANTSAPRAKAVASQTRALRPSMNLSDYLQKRRGGR
jgi:hypothetical protein